MNRLLPAGVHDPFFDKWRKTQALFLEEAHRYFDPVPLFTLPLRDDQVLGARRRCARSGEELWAGTDPAASFRSDRSVPVREDGTGSTSSRWTSRSSTKEDVDLAIASGDLVVRIGNVRHHVPIPRTLVGYSPAGAKVEDGKLTVRFARPDGGTLMAETKKHGSLSKRTSDPAGRRARTRRARRGRARALGPIPGLAVRRARAAFSKPRGGPRRQVLRSGSPAGTAAALAAPRSRASSS